MAGDVDSEQADESGKPETYSFGDLQPISSLFQSKREFFYLAVEAICAAELKIGSFVLLCYTLKRDDHLLTVGVLGGLLLLSVFGLIH
jgi:hypothetical protein